MPNGYLVTLENGSLDPTDSIGGGLVSFSTDSVLGSGTWVWSGTYAGTTYTNTSEPGVYYLATNGNVYFVPDYGPVDTITNASVTSAPTYSTTDGEIDGTDASETIDATYTDADGDSVDGGTGSGTGGLGDSIRAADGDDTISSGAGNDTVYGDEGNDQIDGGSGDDVLYGDGFDSGASESLNWDAAGADESDLSAGFTQTTGDMDVAVSFDTTAQTTGITVESTDTVYTETGEPFDATSNLSLTGSGLGTTSTTNIDFSANTDGISNAVQDVSFRINDIDQSGWQDIVTVNAYDANGNLVPVTISLDGNESLSGNTITAGASSDSSSSANGSALIEIAGSVSSIEIIYENGGSSGQALWVSDIHFTTMVEIGNGNDSIDGGAGDDILHGQDGDDTLVGGTGADQAYGGAGDDRFEVSHGDTVEGGDGDDVFLLLDLGEGNTDGITITGGEGDETGGDLLYLGDVADVSTLVITSEDSVAGGYSGTIQLNDGTVVTFSEIENIFDENLKSVVCFTPGTRILTAQGERPIESLQAGDLVLTRDDGLQPIRWIGATTVEGQGAFAPIYLGRDALEGANRPLIVSPQHRFLVDDWRADLLFAEQEVLVAAKHMINDHSVMQLPCPRVTYIHMMFDRHQIVYAEGVATESFHAADYALSGMGPATRDAMFSAFPELRGDVSAYGPTARTCLKAHEARLLLPANAPQQPDAGQALRNTF